jgi:hypothetical protein
MYTFHFIEQALIALVIAHYLRHIRKNVVETYHYTVLKLHECKGSRFCIVKQSLAVSSFAAIMLVELSPILFYALHLFKG